MFVLHRTPNGGGGSCKNAMYSTWKMPYLISISRKGNSEAPPPPVASGVLFCLPLPPLLGAVVVAFWSAAVPEDPLGLLTSVEAGESLCCDGTLTRAPRSSAAANMLPSDEKTGSVAKASVSAVSSTEWRTWRSRGWRQRSNCLTPWRSISEMVSLRRGLCNLSAVRLSNRKTDASCNIQYSISSSTWHY